LSQSLIKLPFFRRYSARQNSVDFHVKSPKLLNGHQFKIVGFHVSYPKELVEPPAQGKRRASLSCSKPTRRPERVAECVEADSFLCCAVVMVAPMAATSKATAGAGRTERGAINCSRIEPSLGN
jgi:hypothetical protein